MWRSLLRNVVENSCLCVALLKRWWSNKRSHKLKIDKNLGPLSEAVVGHKSQPGCG